jgi:hypothetical protein
VLRHELLVGCDHVHPVQQRTGHVVARRVDAADQLHDHVALGEDAVEVTLRTAEDPGDLRPPASDLFDHVGPLVQQLAKRATHGPLPEDPDPDGPGVAPRSH